MDNIERRDVEPEQTYCTCKPLECKGGPMQECRWVVMGWRPSRAEQDSAEIDWMRRQAKVLVHQRDMADARSERCIRILTRIFSLLPPAPFTSTDGRVFVYRHQDPQAAYDELAAAIRAIPDALAAEATAAFLARDTPVGVQSHQQAQTVGVPPTKTEPHRPDNG